MPNIKDLIGELNARNQEQLTCGLLADVLDAISNAWNTHPPQPARIPGSDGDGKIVTLAGRQGKTSESGLAISYKIDGNWHWFPFSKIKVYGQDSITIPKWIWDSKIEKLQNDAPPPEEPADTEVETGDIPF